jgi:hypothetical protein
MEKAMLELQVRQFSELVHEVFSSTLQDLGFDLEEENEYLLFARKGDIRLIFRLEVAYHICLFSIEIALLGKLGERATSDLYYRHLSVTTIAKYSDPEYEISLKSSSTEEELKEMMETQKGELLKYCKDIIGGDVSLWSRIADILIEQAENSKHKFHRRR